MWQKMIFVVISGMCLGQFIVTQAYCDANGIRNIGRSRCGSCKHTLNVVDLLPILGYYLRKGKCHYCGAEFSNRYFKTEIKMGVIGVLTLPMIRYQKDGLLLSILVLLVVTLMTYIEKLNQYKKESAK